MMDEHVNVTLMAAGRRTDVRLPVRITVFKLIRELAQIFPGLDAGLTRFQLLVAAKGLLLGEEDVLGDFPITDGDTIELV